MSTPIFFGTEKECRRMAANSKLPIPLYDDAENEIGKVTALRAEHRPGQSWSVEAEMEFDFGKIRDAIWYGTYGEIDL